MFVTPRARVWVICIAVVVLSSAVPRAAKAQLNGFNIKGDAGLKAGSQAPPGVYVGANFYRYNTDRINDRSGDQRNPAGDLDLFLGGPLLNVVTTKTILGGNYGIVLALPFMNTQIEAPRLDSNPSPAFSDIYLSPVNLGWHFKRADVMSGYGIFMPTGRYTAGADDNTGLGMWGHELTTGVTAYLDEQRTWHAATNSAFEFHSGKKDSAAHVGTLLTLEGGLGRDFMGGGLSVGAAYYAQWKLSEDTLTGLPALLVQGKNRVAGVGPEVSLALASKKKQIVYGFLTVRYHWEVAARTTTQGQGLNILLVVPTKPIHLAAPPAAP